MRYNYRAIARLDCLKPKIVPPINHKINPSSFYNRAFSSQTIIPETADMGKDKVSYQLKTPKGTKDCILFSPLHYLIRR